MIRTGKMFSAYRSGVELTKPELRNVEAKLCSPIRRRLQRDHSWPHSGGAPARSSVAIDLTVLLSYCVDAAGLDDEAAAGSAEFVAKVAVVGKKGNARRKSGKIVRIKPQAALPVGTRLAVARHISGQQCCAILQSLKRQLVWLAGKHGIFGNIAGCDHHMR